MKEIIEKYSVNDFLDVLPSSTRSVAYETNEKGIDLSQLIVHLANGPGEGLATKGGVFWPRDLLPQIAKELFTLVCTDDERYSSWREKLKSKGTTTAQIVVALSASAIASTLGFTVALCVPFVALIFASAAKVGAEAWCQQMQTSVSQARVIDSGEPSKPPPQIQ